MKPRQMTDGERELHDQAERDAVDDMLRVSVGDGKYTVVQSLAGRLRALRYGEEWRDLVGDGLVLALAQEVDALRTWIQSLPSRIEEADSFLCECGRLGGELDCRHCAAHIKLYNEANALANE